MKYRADIDGLRAVAILPVLFFHAFPNRVQGGFVGVDIFFVISGFLISSVVFHGLETNTFSFAGFYARRVRRIFPALVIVLAFCALLGWLGLTDGEYRRLGKHIAGAAVFSSNFVLHQERGYFNASDQLKPLLHLWSLGVEEQFYIVWPVIALICWRWRIALPAAAVLACISFLLNVAFGAANHDDAFFLPWMRAWELMIGCGLAAAFGASRPAAGGAPRKSLPARTFGNGIVRNAMAAAGLILIAGGIVLLYSGRPVWMTIAPVAGAALLIAAGPHAWINRRLLSHRWFVACGIVSYPLYLWHWPLLCGLNIMYAGMPPAWLRVAALFLSAVLAWATYRWVEMPVRQGGRLLPKALSLCALMVCAGGIGLFAERGQFTPRAHRYQAGRVDQAGESDFQAGLTGFSFQGGAANRAANPMHAEEALYVGDSFMEQFLPRISRLIAADPAHFRTAVFVTQHGCAAITKVASPSDPSCKGLGERAAAYGMKDSVKAVVFSSRWPMVFSSGYCVFQGQRGDLRMRPGTPGTELAYQELERTVHGLRQHGKKVYLVLSTPVDEALDPARLVRRRFGDFSAVDGAGVNRQKVELPRTAINARLREIGVRTGAEIVEPLDFLCGPAWCPALAPDGGLMYRNQSHLFPQFVKDHVTFLDRTLRAE